MAFRASEKSPQGRTKNCLLNPIRFSYKTASSDDREVLFCFIYPIEANSLGAASADLSRTVGFWDVPIYLRIRLITLCSEKKG
jgi:hypothetical protein